MEKSRLSGLQPKKKRLRFENGCIYFSRLTERKFFFALTLVMLFLGVIFRLEGLQ